MKRTESCGRLTRLVGRGNLKQLMQVLAVGKNEESTSWKLIAGWSLNPSIGSSSVPVTKYKIFSSVRLSLRPPKNRNQI